MQFDGLEGPRYSRSPGTIALIGAAGAIISALIAALLELGGRRRALANRLRETLDEQRALQDSAIVGIGLFAGGVIVRCNRGLEEMMEYPVGSLTGKPCAVLAMPGANLDPFTGGDDGPRRAELELQRSDGSALWCIVNGRMLDPAAPDKGWVWVINDISERKQTEAALVHTKYGLEHSLTELEQQKNNVERAHADLSAVLATLRQAQTNLITSEKMASLGALVAGIAHELNTPIGNSLLTATALADMVADFEKRLASEGGVKRSTLEAHLADARHACKIMAGSLARAAELITSFKQVAVDQASGQRRPFHLDEVVHDTLATYAAQLRRANCEVVIDVEAGLVFDSYPGSVGQVLSNLINNAMLHAFEGRSRGRISVSAKSVGDSVQLLFRDDGVGMSARTLHQIFDPFFTTKMGQGGSGLGMNIVYNIVTGVLKGTIGIESEPGQGSCVTLTLPLVVPENPADPASRAGLTALSS
ncbi:PAS domain-containing sensor histidine kinase [Oxalobacteraceae bacterium]|nr:PAS domain-containing sensor histidine kinase [Oxalobacteraceae bacterium]